MELQFMHRCYVDWNQPAGCAGVIPSTFLKKSLRRMMPTPSLILEERIMVLEVPKILGLRTMTCQWTLQLSPPTM
jgi:hypothetical protein